MLSVLHTHTHTFSACLIVCLLSTPHGLHFILMTTSAFFSSALISDYGIIIYSVWNSIILLSLLFRYVLYFKYNTCILTGHFSFVLFFDNFLLVVGSDSAFRACLWLFLYTPLLFRPLLRSCWSSLALRRLLLPCSASSVWEWGSVETDSWSVSVFTRKRGTAHSDPPSRPPVQPSSAPRTPPPHPPGWKFLVCGPNSKIPNLSDLPGEQQCIDSHSRTHAH